MADDELIILDADGSSFLVSNAVAVVLWEALAAPATVDQLVDIVAARFSGVDRATAMTDVATFLATLTARGLLRVDEPV